MRNYLSLVSRKKYIWRFCLFLCHLNCTDNKPPVLFATRNKIYTFI